MPEPGLHLVHEPTPEARKALFDLLPGPTDGRMAFAQIVRWHRREGFEHGRQASQRVRGPDALIGQKDASWSRSICDRLDVARAGIAAYGPMLASSLRMGPQLVVNE